jgi:sugar (pentulose or hexulose) kinase
VTGMGAIAVIDDLGYLTADAHLSALRTAAGHARDALELRLLADMLGIPLHAIEINERNGR